MITLCELLENFCILIHLCKFLDTGSVINLSRSSKFISTLITDSCHSFGVQLGLNTTSINTMKSPINTVSVNPLDNTAAFQSGSSIHVINLYTGKSVKHELPDPSYDSGYKTLQRLSVSSKYLVYTCNFTTLEIINLLNMNGVSHTIPNFSATIKVIEDTMIFTATEGKLGFMHLTDPSRIVYYDIIPIKEQIIYFDSDGNLTILSYGENLFTWDNNQCCMVSVIDRTEHSYTNKVSPFGTDVQASKATCATFSFCAKFIEVWDVISCQLTGRISIAWYDTFSLSHPHLLVEHHLCVSVELSLFDISSTPEFVSVLSGDIHFIDDTECAQRHSFLTWSSHVTYGKNVDAEKWSLKDGHHGKVIIGQLL